METLRLKPLQHRPDARDTLLRQRRLAERDAQRHRTGVGKCRRVLRCCSRQCSVLALQCFELRAHRGQLRLAATELRSACAHSNASAAATRSAPAASASGRARLLRRGAGCAAP